MTQGTLRVTDMFCFLPVLVVTGLHASAQTQRSPHTERENFAQCEFRLGWPDFTRRGHRPASVASACWASLPLLFSVLWKYH